MACLLAILNTNDAPVDGRLLRSLMDVPPFVGPDRAEIWTSGAIGLGAAARRTSQPERALPVSRRDRLWAVMDGRLDDRAALLRMLESRLDERLSGAPDIELVLAAYECWGADCAAHLLGDFSFCVWDAERRQLVCARDHFGVKPLYYARVGPTIVISNVLRSVRRHPGISVCLDDLAVGDTLLFGLAMDPSRTMFADVSGFRQRTCSCVRPRASPGSTVTGQSSLQSPATIRTRDNPSRNLPQPCGWRSPTAFAAVRLASS
jgi:asparagine synthase (glutamine-hydrolysing)